MGCEVASSDGVSRIGLEGEEGRWWWWGEGGGGGVGFEVGAEEPVAV